MAMAMESDLQPHIVISAAEKMARKSLRVLVFASGSIKDTPKPGKGSQAQSCSSIPRLRTDRGSTQERRSCIRRASRCWHQRYE